MIPLRLVEDDNCDDIDEAIATSTPEEKKQSYVEFLLLEASI
jgi:hypothetical protein